MAHKKRSRKVGKKSRGKGKLVPARSHGKKSMKRSRKRA